VFSTFQSRFKYEARTVIATMLVTAGKIKVALKLLILFMAVLISSQDLQNSSICDQRFRKYGSLLRRCVSIVRNFGLTRDRASQQSIQAAIDFHCNNRPSFAIIDKGGNKERSCIWVENGHFYGMGLS
jgi:DNA polymerase-3 subunit epsilon